MSKRSTGEYESRNGGRRGRVEYSRTETEPPSIAVATAIARYTGDEVTASNTTLYEHVDPDALDALFENQYDGSRRGDGEIEFDVEDATVVVGPDTVRVYDAAVH